jgi:CBS domain-containing protein
MKVSELMCRPVVFCGASDSANTAARLMWEQDVGTVPIVGEDGRLVGIVTDRDLCMAVYTQGRSLESIPVASAMARDVVSCRPDDPVRVAEKLMRKKMVRRLPVVDAAQRPVGVISLNDIVRRTARRRSDTGRPEREFVKTMGAICQRRRHPGEKLEVAVPESC